MRRESLRDWIGWAVLAVVLVSACGDGAGRERSDGVDTAAEAPSPVEASSEPGRADSVVIDPRADGELTVEAVEDLCREGRGILERAFALSGTGSVIRVLDADRGEERVGCRVEAEGRVAALPGGRGDIVPLLMAAYRGWGEPDWRYAADGVEASSMAYRRGDLLCVHEAVWQVMEDPSDPESLEEGRSDGASESGQSFWVTIDCIRDPYDSDGLRAGW